MHSLRTDIFNKLLSVSLILCTLGAIATIIYLTTSPSSSESSTEFYVLGYNTLAALYPSTLVIHNDPISGKYAGEMGNVTLGIVNHERQTVTYSVITKIDERQVSIFFEGKSVNQITQIRLRQGEKWEGEVGFAPQHVGDNQKVEFFLYKSGATEAENTLYLWINVSEAK